MEQKEEEEGASDLYHRTSTAQANDDRLRALNTNNTEFDVKHAVKHIGLPPPPTSPNQNSNLAPQSAYSSFKNYRARNSSNLARYEKPSQKRNKVPKLSKSHSANEKKKANKTRRHASEDITYQPSAERDDQRLQRANSARLISDLSLSEKIYQNRRTVLHRLRGKNKKDVMSKLDISIGKVEDKLKVYVRNLVTLGDELSGIRREQEKELGEWEAINNFSLSNLCRSYYSNYILLISIRIEIGRQYCECFRDKYRQLKKTRDRIKKDARKFSLDDLVLTVEAAMMSASNIRLPSEIKLKRQDEAALKGVIAELKKRYLSAKYEDIVAPMSAEDRTKHILSMLVQIIDTSNKTEKGLPYFHPRDNGYQVPFEQLLYDPRFEQKETIDAFVGRNNDSLTAISTFIYKLTNSFLDECQLNRDSPYFEKLFWDCTNLMIGRSIFPKFSAVIANVCSRDVQSVEADEVYKKQVQWMSKLRDKQIGIEPQFTHIKSTTHTHASPIFVIDDEEENTAYYRPIKRLTGLAKIAVPQDSIVLVIDTVHDIHNTAIKYAKIHKPQQQVIVSGDSLFPIVVFCLVQSNVTHWNQWMFMMRNFYTKRILEFGQTGYCFSLIDAAVKYIMEQKPDSPFYNQ